MVSSLISKSNRITYSLMYKHTLYTNLSILLGCSKTNCISLLDFFPYLLLLIWSTPTVHTLNTFLNTKYWFPLITEGTCAAGRFCDVSLYGPIMVYFTESWLCSGLLFSEIVSLEHKWVKMHNSCPKISCWCCRIAEILQKYGYVEES